MNGCLTGVLIQLIARGFGAERVGPLLAALADMAARHEVLDCELVNRELRARGLEDLKVDEPALGLALEALRRAGFISVDPVSVH